MFFTDAVFSENVRRVAYLISNANYTNERPLVNPHNDARLLASTLRNSLNFTEVIEKKDLSRAEMFDLVSEIGRKSKGADAVVVYYSGHGMKGPGGNYLIPVDARINQEDHVRRDGILASELVESLQSAAPRVAMLVLDACRDSPYATRTRSGAKGLARMNVSGGNLVVAYATQDGSTADDGKDGNSPYAKALADQLKDKSKPLLAQLDGVRRNVRALTNNSQNPTREGDLEVNIYLINPTININNSGNQGSSEGGRVQTPAEIEQAAWMETDKANTIAAYEAFIDLYPQSPYVSRAKLKIAILRPPQGSNTSANAPVQSNLVSAPLQVVRIGHVAPMSGAQAPYGKDNENGVRMAIEELNARGVIVGGSRVRFEIYGEDDGADPKMGVSAAQRMCSARVAAVVGHLNSGTSIPASRIYSECGIPHITPSATNPNLTKPGYKTTFRLLVNDNDLGARLAHHAMASAGIRRLAVIDDRTGYGQGVAASFVSAAVARGAQLVDQQFTTDKATDFFAILTAIKAKNPDTIFYGGMDPQAGPMLRQMEQLGMSNVKFYGGDGICTTELAKLSSGARTLNNVYCAEGGVSLAKMNGGRSWKSRYDSKFPGQFQVYSPYTYDATMVLADAMVRANSTNPANFLKALAETDYSGVTGRIRFDARGELVDGLVTVYKYANGGKTVTE